MSVWSLRGPWGEVVASVRADDGEFEWEARETTDAILMTDLLETARDEWPADGRWLEPGAYSPDLLEEAVRRAAKEFKGKVAMVEGNPPAPPGTIF